MRRAETLLYAFTIAFGFTLAKKGLHKDWEETLNQRRYTFTKPFVVIVGQHSVLVGMTYTMVQQTIDRC